MKKIKPWLHQSAYLAPLSPACRMCATGAKLVLFSTGICHEHCYYCPLSFKKGGKDVIYADEWRLSNENDIETLLQEARFINAHGAGITGGDPLVVWKRVTTFIQVMKTTFGDKFHIHLYTSGLHHAEHIPDLVSAGLDEIRFHPRPQQWDTMSKNPLSQVITSAVKTGVDTAIEIPVIPGYFHQIFDLLRWSDHQGVSWVNLNELEFSERNTRAFSRLGFQVKSEVSSAVQGSQLLARRLLRSSAEESFSVGVHYCSVSFKDGVQLRNRIKRRAAHVAKPYDVVTEDGTLVRGIIVHRSTKRLHHLHQTLQSINKIPSRHLHYNTIKHRLEIGGWILETIADSLSKQGFQCYLIEEYPTADALEVERIPLPLSV